jgi:tetratricopeptide (TPR) repeat protein
MLTTSSTPQKEPHLERLDSSRTLGNNLGVRWGYRILGIICHSKGKIEEAVTHFEVALGIASSSGYRTRLFWNNYALAELFSNKERFDEAHIHIERAKSRAVDGTFLLGRGIKVQVEFWYKRRRLEEAKFEALRAGDVFEKLCVVWDPEKCRDLLQDRQNEINNLVSTRESDGNGELFKMVLFPIPINSPLLGRGSG